MEFYKVEVTTEDGAEEHIVRSKNKRNAITNVLTNIVKAEHVSQVKCQKVLPQFLAVQEEKK